MGLLSKVFLLFCCMALFNFKRKNSKSECDASNDAAYDDGYAAGKKDGCDSGNEYGYEYGYQYYENLYSECQRNSDCLESSKPKCISGVCKELSGGVLIMGGLVFGGGNSKDVDVDKMGECVLNTNSIPQNSVIGAAAVYDDLVFLCSGHTGSVYTDKCYIRSPSGEWTEGPSLHRGAEGMTLNKVGSTLVAIGGYNGAVLNSVEILHPGSVSWEQQTYTINPARYFHCAVTISSTQVILAGGLSSSNLPNTEMLNLNTGSITRYANLPLALLGHSCVLHQGRILLAGGYKIGNIGSSQVFTLDYSNQGNSWISTTSMINVRSSFSMNIVHGVPTVYGGYNYGIPGTVKSIEQYVGGVWKSQVLTPPRFGHTSVVIC